jgi:hypothetical protein
MSFRGCGGDASTPQRERHHPRKCGHHAAVIEEAHRIDVPSIGAGFGVICDRRFREAGDEREKRHICNDLHILAKWLRHGLDGWPEPAQSLRSLF